MQSESTWKQVVRVAHLLGGLRGLNNPGPEIHICSGVPGATLYSITISEYAQLYSQLAGEGLTILGLEFYEHVDQARGIRPAQWRPFYPGRGWLEEETHRSWREITNSGFDQPTLEIADIAGRIAFEIRACSCRLKDLSDAYSRELQALDRLGELVDYKKFQSEHTFSLYLALHAMLVDMCTLRDYLAEFIANQIFKDWLPKGVTYIDSMAKLRVRLLPLIPDDELSQELRRITDSTNENPWLARLGDYRNLVVHVSPISQAAGHTFVVQKRIVTKTSDSLPIIYFPLPPDPESIKRKRRAGGLPFQTFQDWVETSRINPEDVNAPDALSFCGGNFKLLLDLSHRIGLRSPIKAKPLILDAGDIIGNLKFTKR